MNTQTLMQCVPDLEAGKVAILADGTPVSYTNIQLEGKSFAGVVSGHQVDISSAGELVRWVHAISPGATAWITLTVEQFERRLCEDILLVALAAPAGSKTLKQMQPDLEKGASFTLASGWPQDCVTKSSAGYRGIIMGVSVEASDLDSLIAQVRLISPIAATLAVWAVAQEAKA